VSKAKSGERVVKRGGLWGRRGWRLDDGDSQMPIECQAALKDSPRPKRQ